MRDPYSEIRQHLKVLKLKEMERRLDDIMARALADKLPISTVLEQLFSHEALSLIERRIERRIKADKSNRVNQGLYS
jgi:uncharacterized protein YdaU (DUF1376 family)